MKIFTFVIALVISCAVFSQSPNDFVFTADFSDNTANRNFSSNEISGTGIIVVDWGDGQTDSFNNPSNQRILHLFPSNNNYTITISGSLDSFKIAQNRIPIVITQWGTSQWKTMREAFLNCTNLDIVASIPPDLSLVTDMSSMFESAFNFNSDLSAWDTSNVTDMSSMFRFAGNFNSDLSSWDVSNVTNMLLMFQRADDFTSDLSNWNVSNVTNMAGLFANATGPGAPSSFNSDLSSWDISNVTNTSDMFLGAVNFTSDLSGWDVSNVTNISGMFRSAVSFTSDLSSWDVSNATNMSQVFESAYLFESDLSGWDVSNVINMSGMFSNALIFNSDLSSWNVSNVVNMSHMFGNVDGAFPVKIFNTDLSAWDVSNVTDMSGMFHSTGLFNLELNTWDVSNVTDMSLMFEKAAVFNSDISNWDVSNVTDMRSMFEEASNFNSDISSWDVSNVTDMRNMFEEASNFNSDISSWDVSNVTLMDFMFSNATNFNSNISSWDVSNIQHFVATFQGASSFNQNLSFWNFGAVYSYSRLWSFLQDSGLDVVNYDLLLKRLVDLNVNNIEIGTQGLQYCDSFSRNILLQRGWIFYNDSLSSTCPDNTLSGIISFDMDNNGCNPSDILTENLVVEINDGNNTIEVFTNNGQFSTTLFPGTYTITPRFDTTSFTISPATATLTVANAATVSQNFCLTAVAPVDDLEVSVLPLEEARPGFDTNYKLIYKNKGNTQLSGSLNFTYQDDFMDFLAATPATSSSSVGSLNWDFVGLNPFETREIEFSMNLNTPTDPSFPLNSNDLLNFNAVINPSTSDNTRLDNVFDIQQIVVNSYDPNDKTCLQGNVIAPEMVGEYVHYRIRFENEGTASAVNVRIVDYIDLAKFDITTLTPLSSSHDYTAKITEGNKVEFIFDNIQLPFTAPVSQGYVFFKIKTLDTLVLGDDFSNQAEIYFDFNFPIITNLETTAVDVTAGLNDNNLFKTILYPNPTSNSTTLTSTVEFKEYTIYNTLGSLILSEKLNSPEVNHEISVESLIPGLYFINVTGDHGSTVIKMIKN
jgi:surface protein